MKRRPPSLSDLPAPPAGHTGWPWTEAGPLPPEGAGPLPRISIITPSFNQAGYIEETIRSVLLQNYAELDYIVIDGGSDDGTLEILQHYSAWLRWISEPDRGQTDAINKGLRRAAGEILAYLNSDDTYCPGALHRIAAVFRDRPEAGLAYGDCEVVDEHSRPMGYLPRHKFSLKRMVERGEFLPQQAVFWRRQAQDQAGLFDASLHYAMDHDFFIRVGRAFPVVYLPETVARFRMHGTSKTVSQSEKHWREALLVSERHGLKPTSLWYWWRRLRHWGLRRLPRPVQGWVRRRLGRPQDPYLYADLS